MVLRSTFTLLALTLAHGAFAQAYPTKPVRLVVPFPPGGGNDIVARTVNIRLPAMLGQQVVIDNRPGAGGNLGAELVARSPADGYTLLIANNSLTANFSLFRKLPYDPFKDFQPIAMGATSPNMVVVHPSMPVKSIKELVAIAKARPGQLVFGSPGAGTGSHLAGELFKARAGIDMLHVAYKGAGPLMVEQVGGHVMVTMTAPLVSWPFVESGKVRAIAVTSEKRFSLTPDIPTVAEAGYTEFDVTSWFAYFAPAGTPRDVVNRLAADIGKAVQTPEVRERYATSKMEGGGGTPEELAAFIRKDWEVADKVIKAQGIRLD